MSSHCLAEQLVVERTSSNQLMAEAESAQAFRESLEAQLDWVGRAVQMLCRVFQTRVFLVEAAVEAEIRWRPMWVNLEAGEKTDLCGLVGFRCKVSVKHSHWVLGPA